MGAVAAWDIRRVRSKLNNRVREGNKEKIIVRQRVKERFNVYSLCQ